MESSRVKTGQQHGIKKGSHPTAAWAANVCICVPALQQTGVEWERRPATTLQRLQVICGALQILYLRRVFIFPATLRCAALQVREVSE